MSDWVFSLMKCGKFGVKLNTKCFGEKKQIVLAISSNVCFRPKGILI